MKTNVGVTIFLSPTQTVQYDNIDGVAIKDKDNANTETTINFNCHQNGNNISYSFVLKNIMGYSIVYYHDL